MGGRSPTSGGSIQRQLLAALVISGESNPRDGASGSRFWTYFWRSCRLKCPLCGQGDVAKNWIRLHDRCSHCGLKIARGHGYYLGSIYFNYGLTVLLLTAVTVPLVIVRAVPFAWITAGAMIFVGLFPLWFLRYARSLFLGFDQYWDQDPRHLGRETKGESTAGRDGVVRNAGTNDVGTNDVALTDRAARELPSEGAESSPPGEGAALEAATSKPLFICPFCHVRQPFPEHRTTGECVRCGNKVLYLPPPVRNLRD